MSVVRMIPLDKDGNPIKKKKKPEPRLEMGTWQDYHPPIPDLKISKPVVSLPLGGDHVDPAPRKGPREMDTQGKRVSIDREPDIDLSKWLDKDKQIDPAPMPVDRGQTKPSDLKIRRETDPAPITLPGRKVSDMVIGPDTPRYGSTQGDVSNRFGVPKAPQVTTPPNSMFMRSQNAAGVRMKRSKAARSGRSSKGTKQFNRMMSIKSLNV